MVGNLGYEFMDGDTMSPGEFRVLAVEPELFEKFYNRKPSAYEAFIVSDVVVVADSSLSLVGG